jgi:hypothetical protein
MMDNEYERTRDLLRRSSIPPAPAGLEDRVLLRLAEAADKQAKKRAAWSGLLRFAAIGLLLIAIGQSFFPGGTARTVVQSVGQLTSNPGEKVSWLLENTFFLFPLVGLYLITKIYKLKAR